MLFSELYSAYYNAVAKILSSAVNGGITDRQLREAVSLSAFDESILTIETALKDQQWQLLYKDGTTPLEHAPAMPLTTLQKRWIKSVYLDPRIRLFTDDTPSWLDDVEPLFTDEDVCVFDKYADGDDFTDETYIRFFHMILHAAENSLPLKLSVRNRHGHIRNTVMVPKVIEYSEKDDKFRIMGDSSTSTVTVNIGRITQCSVYEGNVSLSPSEQEYETVEFDLFDTRKALERVLMHFAHFEKEVERLDESHYHVILRYEHSDRTELLIRILSFGPMIKVTAPKSFILLIKMRLERQKQYLPPASL
ncbi:MAG: WYL domain-containing protein [Oscillospiraceae bacterium]|nr:WYL domain-containing protein [Oscillospiraceae bacterium]MBQ8978626.1 WYL domain-containing protein [Oscillospiraceae bacterium]